MAAAQVVEYYQRMNGFPSSAEVVMLGTFSAWNLGTLQARAIPMAQALVAQGVDVAIVTTPWDQPAEAGVIDVINGVPLINTKSTSTMLPVQAVRDQLGWVEKLKPQLIHTMKPRGFGGFASLALLGKLPLIVDSDDWEGDGGWNDSGKYSWIQQRLFHAQERDLLKRADGVTAASTLLAQRAVTLRGSDNGVHLIANGLSRQRMDDLRAARTAPPPAIEPPVVVLYSRFEEFPSDWLSRLAYELAQRTTRSMTLRVIGRDRTAGDPPMVVDSILIELMGYVASAAVPNLLGSATLAVYPYQDSLITRSKQSVKLLELLAAGCPVVASDVGDVARVIGNSGITVSGSDPATFAEAVIALSKQNEVMDEMSRAGQSKARDAFGIDEISAAVLRAYRAAGLNK